MGSCYSNHSEASVHLQNTLPTRPKPPERKQIFTISESRPIRSPRQVKFRESVTDIDRLPASFVAVENKSECDPLGSHLKPNHKCLTTAIGEHEPRNRNNPVPPISPKRSATSPQKQRQRRRLFRRLKSVLQHNRNRPPVINRTLVESEQDPDPGLIRSYQVSFVPEVSLVQISDSSDDDDDEKEEEKKSSKPRLWQSLLIKTTAGWKRKLKRQVDDRPVVMMSSSSSQPPSSQLKPPSAYVGNRNQSNNAAPPSSGSHFGGGGARIISSGFVRKKTEQFQRKLFHHQEPSSDNVGHNELPASKLPLLGTLKSRIPCSQMNSGSSKSTINVSQGLNVPETLRKAKTGDRRKMDSSSCTDLAKPSVSLSAASSNSSVSSQPSASTRQPKPNTTAAKPGKGPLVRRKSSSSSSLEQAATAPLPHKQGVLLAGARDSARPEQPPARTATITGGPVAQRPQIIPVTVTETKVSNLPPPDLNRIGIPLITSRPQAAAVAGLSRQQQSRLHFMYGTAAGAPPPPPLVPPRPTTMAPRFADQRISAPTARYLNRIKMAYNGSASSATTNEPHTTTAPVYGSYESRSRKQLPSTRTGTAAAATVAALASPYRAPGIRKPAVPAATNDMYRKNTEDLNGNFLLQPPSTLEDFFGKDKMIRTANSGHHTLAGGVSVSSSTMDDEEEEMSTCSSARTDDLLSKNSIASLGSWNPMSASLCSTASTTSSFVFDGHDQRTTVGGNISARNMASRTRNASSQSRSTTGGDSASSCSNRDLFLIDDEIADQPELLLFTGNRAGGETENGGARKAATTQDWLVSPTKTLTPSTSVTSTVTHTSSDSPIVSAGIGTESMMQSLNELEHLIMRTNRVDYQSLPCYDDGQQSSKESSPGVDHPANCARQPSPPVAASKLRKRHSYTQSSGHPTIVPVFRRPRPLSFVENDDGSMGLDSPSFRAVSQDLIGIKTLLFRLQNVLQNAETQNPFDKLSHRVSYDSERSSSVDTDPSSSSDAVQTLREENFDLRQHVQLLEQQLIEKERTIRLLQQQMVKYTTAPAGNGGGYYRGDDRKAVRNSTTQTELPGGLAIASNRVPDGVHGGQLIRNAR